MIVCEVGLNHMGDYDYAVLLIEKIAETETDAVSFQIRESTFYEKNTDYLLPISFYKKAKKYLNSKGIKFGYSVCDISYADYVGDVVGDFYKILSWAITDSNLVYKVSALGPEVIYLSTGMSDFNEINLLITKYTKLKKQLSLIHTQLSFDIKDVNLSVIPEMKKRYNIPIGYGHHCEEMKVLEYASGFQPDDIFFYIKWDKKYDCPDEKHAVNLDDIDAVIGGIKLLKKSIGKAEKIKMNNNIERLK